MSTEALTTHLDLPPELLDQIFSHVTRPSQQTLHAAALVSRAWYRTAIRRLYQRPEVTGKHFNAFVRTVCPSINAHVRYNGLADLIKRLDLSSLVHHASKSLTARVLGRVKHNLEEFIAPQASFGVNSLAALSKCTRLRCLDLGFVSQGIPISDLLRSIHGLQTLVSVHLPRAYVRMVRGWGRSNPCTEWPPNMKTIHVNGGFNENDIKYLRTLPHSTSEVWLEYCPFPGTEMLYMFFYNVGWHLKTLHVTIPKRNGNELPFRICIPSFCQYLHVLSINVEVLESHCEEMDMIIEQLSLFLSIERLEIRCLDDHDETFSDRWLCLIAECLYKRAWPSLRILRVHRRFRWTNKTVKTRHVLGIDTLLKAMAREDGEHATITEDMAGVIFFGDP